MFGGGCEEAVECRAFRAKSPYGDERILPKNSVKCMIKHQVTIYKDSAVDIDVIITEQVGLVRSRREAMELLCDLWEIFQGIISEELCDIGICEELVFPAIDLFLELLEHFLRNGVLGCLYDCFGDGCATILFGRAHNLSTPRRRFPTTAFISGASITPSTKRHHYLPPIKYSNGFIGGCVHQNEGNERIDEHGGGVTIATDSSLGGKGKINVFLYL